MNYRRAVHEAGHAAVAGKLGVSIRRVSLDDPGGGLTEYGEPVADLDLLTWSVVTFAGGSAERLIFGDARLTAADDCEAQKIGAAFVNPTGERCRVDEHLHRLSAMADRQVKALRPQIERIAGALVKSRELSGAQLAPLLLAPGVEP